jgi:endonuclease YncB( thermonuclease family)
MGNILGCAYVKYNYDINKLNNINSDDISIFSLNGYSTQAKVVDVYDGDTCTIVFKWEGKYRKFKCRCYGYDSPEMKPRLNIENRDEIKENAVKAKERLIELTTYIVRVECMDFDKYGRLLVKLYKNNNSLINDIMINEGHGYVYHGGTKH